MTRNLIKIALFTNVSFECMDTRPRSPRSSALAEVDAVVREVFAQNLSKSSSFILLGKCHPRGICPSWTFCKHCSARTANGDVSAQPTAILTNA